MARKKSLVICNTTLFFVTIIHPFLCVSDSASSNTLHQGDTLNSSGTLISSGGNFSLQFFKHENSDGNQSYLGIKYISFPTQRNNDGQETSMVWVANRDEPIDGNDGILTIDSMGKLMVNKHKGGDPIEIYQGETVAVNTSATLLDNGNFELRVVNSNGSSGRLLWQSFDYPTDTLLPGMKLGINHKTGQNLSLTSWFNSSSPASGAFTLEWDGRQLVIRRRGMIYWTSGALMRSSSGSTYFEFVNATATQNYILINETNVDWEYFTYSVNNKSKLLLDYDGLLQDADRLQIIDVRECYGYNTDNGCVKWEQPKCRGPNMKFEILSGSFLRPNGNIASSSSYNNSSIFTPSDCREICWENCDCVGFKWFDFGYGCVLWIGKSLKFDRDKSGATIGEEVLIIKPSDDRGKKVSWKVAAIAVSVLVFVIAILCYVGRKLKLQGYITISKDKNLSELATLDMIANELEDGGQNLKVYSFACIVQATNNFSLETKLGEGGFGPVYKGKLPEGHEIAVKRLSKRSGQGLVEFKNELVLIGKLQHMNLVRLLGFCMHKEEKILIYEYLPNKSLDSFLFDPSKKGLLDWIKRVNIIEQIAQGLLYLHKYSRLKIIHRDLKASNILLDENMNPKISDFGIARIFKQDELRENTSTIVGTLGYMSPEYAMEGIFSVKSDVFSFGVLLLEIVSGRRNSSFYGHDDSMNLIEYAWELWQKDSGLDLVDQILKDSCSKNQVLRFIHVGLACVEDCPVDRPAISKVISMLTKETWPLPVIKKPACIIRRRLVADEEMQNNSRNHSVNGLTISSMSAR